MVDAAVLARKVAAIRDAVGRIGEVLPETPAARVHTVARAELADLLAFCDQLAARARF